MCVSISINVFLTYTRLTNIHTYIHTDKHKLSSLFYLSCGRFVFIPICLTHTFTYFRVLGAMTLPDLKNRFNVVRSEVRVAALVPSEVPNLFGEVIGYVTSLVVSAPRLA